MGKLRLTLLCQQRSVLSKIWFFQCMDIELDYRESWALKNWCFWTVVLEKTVESPLDCKEIQPVHPKGDQSWMFIGSSNTLATWCKELTHWKRPRCWGRLKAAGEGDDRGWDGQMVSPIQWTWVWVNSGSWWWTGRPGVRQSRGSQRFRDNWATELNGFKRLLPVPLYLPLPPFSFFWTQHNNFSKV